MKKIILTLLAAMPLCASAQSLEFKNKSINIGDIQFMRPATATFEAKNTTSGDIKITDVLPGSGFSNVSYPKERIPAGADFKITATYDAKLMGHFQRGIEVYVEDVKEPLYITLAGNVVEKAEVKYAGTYPYTVGGLKTDMDAIEFDDVNRGEVHEMDIHIMNPTDQTVEPTLMHLPAWLRAEFSPTRLTPKKEGVIHLTLNSKKMDANSLGLIQASVYLAQKAGDKVSADKEMEVSAILLPPESALSENAKQYAPHINLSTKAVDMTDFKGKPKKKAEITITNTGKTTLEIRSLQQFTVGFEITLPKTKLLPGESTKMKIVGYAEQLAKVRTRPRVLMITNDPSNQKVIIDINK